MRGLSKVLLVIFVLILNVGCDQISKNIARQHIPDSHEIGFLNNHFVLIKAENRGAFLSAGHDLPEALRTIILMGLPIAMLIFALFYIFRNNQNSIFRIISISFIIGGGIGNLYDRIFRGSVTDFLYIDFGIFETGIFNFADVSIMLGIFLVLSEPFLTNKKAIEQ
jgi:signal peptidase II